MIRRRKFPLVGDGGGVWSFIHVADAAEATVAAIEHGSRGVYNVVDDDPAPVAEWLPALAQAAGRQEADARAAVRRTAVRRRGRRGDDDRDPRRIERQGQARAGVAPGPPELARRVRSGMTDREQLLDELRPVAFAIAYRMLGSVSEAEDVVQEALLRVHQALEAGEQIASPRAFVATVTTRLAINELRSARARRERYVGEWLPEPIITDGIDDPARHAETADSLSLAMLVLLESLSPEQRAVLLLHDVFDYRYHGDRGDRRQERGQRAPTRHPRPTSRRAAPAALPDDPRAARRAGATLLRRGRAGRSRRARGAARPRRRADRRRRRQGAGGRADAARAQPRGQHARSNGFAWSAGSPACRVRPVEVNGGPGALYLDGEQRVIGVIALDIAGGQITEHQRDRQPRQADAPGADR